MGDWLEHPKGCGTEACCDYCELRMLALKVLSENKKQRTSLCLKLVIGSQVRDVTLLLSAVPFTYLEKRCAILIIEDITRLKSLFPPDTQTGFRGILGRDKKIKELIDTIRQVARTHAPALLQGETGTGKELEKEVAAGRFRQDLYYRICVMPISLLPLRERMGDIPLLVDHFLTLYADEFFGKKVRLSPAVLSILEAHTWPGNVRELQSAFRFALAKCQGHMIESQHLPPTLQLGMFESSTIRRRKPNLQAMDVADALKKADGNKQKAAEILGVSRSTLYRFFATQEKFPADRPSF